MLVIDQRWDMIYFVMQELIGRNSVEAYYYYLHKVNWLENNLSYEKWSLDYSSNICINGINIPCGIRINEFRDAVRFCRDCI